MLQQRVHLSIEVGERANDYQEIAARDKLSELQLRLRQLLDQADQISKEQNYQRVSQRLNDTLIETRACRDCNTGIPPVFPIPKYRY